MSKAETYSKIDLRDKEFQSWWQNNLFYTDDPLLEIYKPLFTFNNSVDVADLEYLEFLRISLRAWDTLTKEINAYLEKERKSQKLDLSRLPKTPPVLFAYLL